MSKTIRLTILIALTAFLVLAPIGCDRLDDVPPSAADDEIKLLIQLDLKEDIGMLLIDYALDGAPCIGGVANADRSMIRQDDRLDFSFNKSESQSSSEADLTVTFTFLTEYVEPNYEHLYPEELKLSVGTISLKAGYGQTYTVTIHEDAPHAYRVVLDDA